MSEVLLHPKSEALQPLPAASFSVKVVNHATALCAYSEGLADLAASASEPNIFYEPWMLLPSVELLGKQNQFAFVLIFRHLHTGLQLCGFFPLELRRSYRGIPVSVATFWSFLGFQWCAPLIRKGMEHPCLRAFLEWLCSETRRYSLVEFPSLPAEGAMTRAVIDVVREFGLACHISEIYNRAFLRRARDADTCIRSALPGRRLKELNRVRRRLSEKGNLIFEQLTEDGDVTKWIEEFLELEASGWKGRAGSALACTKGQHRFFIDSACGAFARGQLMMLRMCLDGRPIAYKCNFMSGPGVFAFKIAYDEKFRSFSPGVHLELENIRRFHQLPGVEWMDSCASSENFMANHLWSERRTIQTMLISVGGQASAILLSLLPFMRWAKHTFVPPRPSTCNRPLL